MIKPEKINLSGLVNEVDDNLTRNMIDYLWQYTEEKLDKGNLLNIKNAIENNHFKKVDDRIRDLIGVYEIVIEDIPDWFIEFKKMFLDFVFNNSKEFTYTEIANNKNCLREKKGDYDKFEDCCDCCYFEQPTVVKNEEDVDVKWVCVWEKDLGNTQIKKKIKINGHTRLDFVISNIENENFIFPKVFKQLVELIDALKNITYENYVKGRFENGEKIMKKVCKVLRQITPFSNEELQQYDFYKLYETNKETQEKRYLVISNSIPSILGMSSYAPNHSWTSCQTLFKENYARTYGLSIWQNILDQNSLICYITDFDPTTFYGRAVNWDELKHYNMYQRNMVRFVETTTRQMCERCFTTKKDKEMFCCEHVKQEYVEGEKGLLLDRGYPGIEFSDQIMKVLEGYAKEKGFKLFVPTHYNAGQNSSYKNVSFESNCDKKVDVKEVNPITPIFERVECTGNCKFCKNSTKQRDACFLCLHSFEKCINEKKYDCTNCIIPMIANRESIHSYYNDQNGNGSRITSHDHIITKKGVKSIVECGEMQWK